MKFSYGLYAIEPSPAAPSRFVVARPVIPVRFSGPAGTIDTFALLDTGADESYITKNMADRLGITPVSDAASTVQSASGDMSIVYGEVLLEVEDGSETFAQRITVGIVGEDWSEAILGHIGFLEHFDATFSYFAQVVELTPAGSRMSRSSG